MSLKISSTMFSISLLITYLLWFLQHMPCHTQFCFPSLPYLIDQPRAFASLVMMWDNYSDNLPQNQTVQLFHYEGFYDFGYNLLLE